MQRRSRVPFGAALASLAVAVGGCASSDSHPAPALAVRWPVEVPAGELPDGLAALRVLLFVDGREGFQDTTVSVSRLAMRDGRRVLEHPLLRDLPRGPAVRVTIEGLREDGSLGWIGHAGPFVLRTGERRYADVQMYTLGAPQLVDGGRMPPRFLHAAAPLPDGRVLLCGGFTSAETTSCPADAPPDARCFMLTASRDAWLFDPGSGRFHPVAGGMLEARAGHSATSLPDGRVLVVGGAARALFVLTAITESGGSGAITGYVPAFRSVGGVEAHASFELFEPDAGAEAQDEGRDGDPGRGAFVGGAVDPARPGRTNHARFLHAAVQVPDMPERVLVVGGLAAPDRYEVFDALKPGGYGFYAATGNMLGTPRVVPSAVGLAASGRVWIFGGVVQPRADEELAEIWEAAPGRPEGSVRPATETAFPHAAEMGSMGPPRPELGLWRPAVAPVGGGTHALVVGWYGPLCAPGSTTPRYFETGSADLPRPCPAPTMGMPTRSFTVDGESGATVPTRVHAPHGFAEVAVLDDGKVVVSGGIANTVWSRQAAIDVYSGQVSAGAAVLTDQRLSAITPRLWHTATPLPDAGVLMVGGLALSADVRTATVLGGGEVLYLARPPRVP
ncbi:MAG: hypothetical protein NZ898_15620 [Myxococcota bacterium]|nr:hypothetical protein [Myxococcota bacterium]MDW8363991.1 hypothetical protein [Myxococcales bacterium]